MSSDEMTLLFYNGLYFPKMKELLERYKILENLNVEDIIDQSHAALYKTPLKSRSILDLESFKE